MDIKNFYETTGDEQRIFEEKITRRRAEKRRTDRRRLQCRRMIALFIVVFHVVLIGRSCNRAIKNKDIGTINTNAVDVDVCPDCSNESLITDIAPDDLSDLRSQINNAVASYNGTWSVYVKNLNTGYSVSINDRQVYAASEIKLFAMAAAYQQISDGLLTEEDVHDTLFGMIANSSNEDFNSIVWSVGKYYISDWCSRHGYYDTIQCHGLYPASNADGLATSSGYNLTTTEDLGKLLESIYSGDCISGEYSQRMLDMLFEQNYRSKIPAGVPHNVKVANKTGETDDVSHDAAIVYSDNADYILVVMVDAPGIAWSCNDNIADISGIVYGYFDKKETDS